MNKALSAFKSSVFLQFVLLLIAVDAFIVMGLPKALQEIQPDLLDSRTLWGKIPGFYGSKVNPDIVIMGSSLVLAPAIHCDAAMLPPGDPNKNKIRKQQVHLYSQSKYLENLLKAAYGKDLSIYNLGFPGAMASDNYVLFEELLDSKKRPAFVVLGVAARDFMNSKRNDPEDSKLQDAVRKFHKEKNYTFLDQLRNLPQTLKAHIDEDKDELGLVKYLSTGRLNSFRQGGFKLSQTAPEPALQEVQLPTKTALDRDVSIYTKQYNPPRANIVETQLQYLDRMLMLADKFSIPVVIVNLPVTELNKNLLHKDLLALYEQGVQRIAAKHDCEYLDLDDPTCYEQTDFRDSVHLNAKGGRKFYAKLVSSLSKSRPLNQRIATRQSKID